MLKSATAQGTAAPQGKSMGNRRFLLSSVLYLNQESPFGEKKLIKKFSLKTDIHPPKEMSQASIAKEEQV